MGFHEGVSPFYMYIFYMYIEVTSKVRDQLSLLSMYQLYVSGFHVG